MNRETFWGKSKRKAGGGFVAHAITVHVIDYREHLETYYKHTFSRQVFSSRAAMRSDLAAAIIRARKEGFPILKVWHFEHKNNINPHGLI